MKFTSRIKFLIGMIVVVLLVSGLGLYLANGMSVSHSTKASLDANASSIGTNYAGLVAKQHVEEGDATTKNQPLFEINSSDLKLALDNATVTQQSLPFDIDSTTHNIILRATDNGVVDKIQYRAGSFVPAGGIIATINTADSLYVVATFSLSPPDYARINRKSTLAVKLPDNSTINADIFDISLVSNKDKNTVDTVIKARIKNANISDFRFAVGTPVQATLQLTPYTWYQNVFTYIENLFKPKG